jgi:hypothetical protein
MIVFSLFYALFFMSLGDTSINAFVVKQLKNPKRDPSYR